MSLQKINPTFFSLTKSHNDREKNMNASCIIKMNGQSTEIINPANPNDKPRKFAYDKSYWSHDGYKELPDGYLEPANSQYDDQVRGSRYC